MDFKVCFSSVCRGTNFLRWMDGFQGVFFICLQGTNFLQWTDEFQGVFFICLQGYKFLTMDGWISRCVFHLFAGVQISYDGWMDFKVCFSSVCRVQISYD